MSALSIRLKKGEDRRIRAGHPWIFSNEIDVKVTPLKSFANGEIAIVKAHDESMLGTAYINPHSLITGRLFCLKRYQPLDQAFIQEKIKTADELRKALFDLPYYRLLFSESDYLPGLIIDRFDHDFVVQINTAGMEHKKEEIIHALLVLFPHTRSILWRNDSKVREQEGLTCYVEPAFGEPPQKITVLENGMRYAIPLWKGQKTGWFYDHRLNRARLKHYVKDKTVLDVFSYVGGFGIYAACAGAKRVDCIESSELATTFISENALINDVSEKIHIIQEDAFSAMKTLLQKKQQYDVIILDPPAFVKKFKDRKEGLIAYQRLNEMAIKLLRTNGILVSCSCSMHVMQEDLVHMLEKIAFRTQTELQILERGHQGPDHPLHLSIPETDYLKAIFVRKIKETSGEVRGG